MELALPWGLAAVVTVAFLAVGPGDFGLRLGAVVKGLAACVALGALGIPLVGWLDGAACGAALQALRLGGGGGWVRLPCLTLLLVGWSALPVPFAGWLVTRWRALARRDDDARA